MVDAAPLVMALQNRKQVTLTYQKATTGETVIHTGGIQEIGTNTRGTEVIWLWDTTLEDHIRQFIIANIIDFQVLEADYFANNGFPFKLNGQII